MPLSNAALAHCREMRRAVFFKGSGVFRAFSFSNCADVT